MKIVYFEVGKQPRIMEVENELSKLQELVGGYIECIYFGRMAIVVNEEGLIQRLPINRQIGNQIIVGNFFITAIDEDDFCSLTDMQISKIEELIDEEIQK